MLEDVRLLGEFFDEDFFAYREDADLAWRAQLRGWVCWYVPGARAQHGRRVTPERRKSLPPEINRYSVRNRFLLRLKNQPVVHVARFFVPALSRDLIVVGYVLLREWSSIPAIAAPDLAEAAADHEPAADVGGGAGAVVHVSRAVHGSGLKAQGPSRLTD
jgi:hypothetical protein